MGEKRESDTHYTYTVHIAYHMNVNTVIQYTQRERGRFAALTYSLIITVNTLYL